MWYLFSERDTDLRQSIGFAIFCFQSSHYKILDITYYSCHHFKFSTFSSVVSWSFQIPQYPLCKDMRSIFKTFSVHRLNKYSVFHASLGCAMNHDIDWYIIEYLATDELFSLIIRPRTTKLLGVYWFRSVRPSVCSTSCVRSVAPTVLVGSISYSYILSSNFRRCVACKGSGKIWKFQFLAIFENL